MSSPTHHTNTKKSLPRTPSVLHTSPPSSLSLPGVPHPRATATTTPKYSSAVTTSTRRPHNRHFPPRAASFNTPKLPFQFCRRWCWLM
ncbi:hypothetical protein vseg_016180 [Gypsophila vaccaria]